MKLIRNWLVALVIGMMTLVGYSTNTSSQKRITDFKPPGVKAYGEQKISIVDFTRYSAGAAVLSDSRTSDIDESEQKRIVSNSNNFKSSKTKIVKKTFMYRFPRDGIRDGLKQ